MSSLTSRQRVPDPPTGELPRLALETNTVGHALSASDDPKISRAPRTDYESALLISPRLLRYANFHHLSPNAHFLDTPMM